MPATEIAAVREEGPGIGMISMFAATAFLTRMEPGSEMPGVPASETRAISWPSCSLLMITADRSCSFSL